MDYPKLEVFQYDTLFLLSAPIMGHHGQSFNRVQKVVMNCDVIVLGGGLVGGATALALAKSGLKVVVLDQVDPSSLASAASDGRTTAIALGSCHYLESLGLWHPLHAHAEPITEIYVTTQGSSAHLHYGAKESDGKPLGFIVDNWRLRTATLEQVKNHPHITLIAPDHMQDLHETETHVEIQTQSGVVLKAPLCVVAEGRGSATRQRLGITTKSVPYHQTALVAIVGHTRDHEGAAYEHFLPTGPFALLPMPGKRSTLVWSCTTALAERLQSLSPDQFAAEMQQVFGPTLGDLSLESQIWAYPLVAQLPKTILKGRFVLIGDAAHVMHPVAGQGFNLGLRDTYELAKTLAETHALGLDPMTQMQAYARTRQMDTYSMLGITHGLIRLFSNNAKSVGLLRGLGLGLVNRIGPVKRLLARHAMGLREGA
ncbi:MAG: UbiH/UbiF/VisC/COQ6 family ubiquinone biosynthesis hydroxylase [Holosporales bacterium]